MTMSLPGTIPFFMVAHHAAAAEEPSEGEQELLADINFADGTYTVGGNNVAVGDVFATDVAAGTVWDANDIIPGSGLRGAQDGGTSVPSLIGALKTTVLGVTGSVVLFDFEIDVDSTEQCLNLDISDVSDFAPGNFFNLNNPQDGESLFSLAGQQVNDASAQTAVVAMPQGPTATFSLHRVAIRVSRSHIAVAMDGDVETFEQAAADPLITWSQLNGVGLYDNGYKYLKRIRVYDQETDLVAVTGLS